MNKDEEVRIHCLRLALTTGTHIEAKKPLDKAEEYYNWVIKNRKPVGRPRKKK